MSKLSSMTIGLVLIFIGVQLTLVKSYMLTPTATRFLQEDLNSNNGTLFGGSNQGNKDDGLFSGIFGSSGQSNNSIAGAPAGQSWPYYRTDNASATANAANSSNSSWNSPGQTPSYQNGSVAWSGQAKRLAPPRWVAWPPLFLGIVFFLHGLVLRI